jgi:hypothetical protein
MPMAKYHTSRRFLMNSTSANLTPLGTPAPPNPPKWFAAVEMIRHATNQDWLHKATKEIASSGK